MYMQREKKGIYFKIFSLSDEIMNYLYFLFLWLSIFEFFHITMCFLCKEEELHKIMWFCFIFFLQGVWGGCHSFTLPAGLASPLCSFSPLCFSLPHILSQSSQCIITWPCNSYSIVLVLRTMSSASHCFSRYFSKERWSRVGMEGSRGGMETPYRDMCLRLFFQLRSSRSKSKW